LAHSTQQFFPSYTPLGSQFLGCTQSNPTVYDREAWEASMLMQNCSLHGNKGWSFIMRGEGSWQLLQNNPWTSKSEKPITQEEHNLLPTKNIMHNLKVRKKNHVPENCPTALSNDGLSLMITILNMSGCYLTNSFNRSLSYHESVKYM